MKKNLILLAIGILCTCTFVFFLAFSHQEEPEVLSYTPQIGQMRSICQLAVMESYFHNVAKYYQPEATGIWLWKKDKHFWVEYSGRVKVGIDATQMSMEIQDTLVTVTLPPAEILGSSIDQSSLNVDSFIVAKDSASVEADDQILALSDAQETMKNLASSNEVLMETAQARTQDLLEEYIQQVGSLMGITYTVQWEFLDSSPEVS